jgi:hypothetical protein
MKESLSDMPEGMHLVCSVRGGSLPGFKKLAMRRRGLRQASQEKPGTNRWRKRFVATGAVRRAGGLLGDFWTVAGESGNDSGGEQHSDEGEGDKCIMHMSVLLMESSSELFHTLIFARGWNFPNPTLTLSQNRTGELLSHLGGIWDR